MFAFSRKVRFLHHTIMYNFFYTSRKKQDIYIATSDKKQTNTLFEHIEIISFFKELFQEKVLYVV